MDQLLEAIPSRLLSEWMAFYRMEPFGPERDDVRNAHLMALLANIHRDPKRSSAYEIEDFLLRYGDEEIEARPPEELMQKFKALGFFKEKGS